MDSLQFTYRFPADGNREAFEVTRKADAGQVKALLGLNPRHHFPAQGVPVQVVQGMPVYVTPERGDGRRKHRVFIICKCGAHVPAGRAFSHRCNAFPVEGVEIKTNRARRQLLEWGDLTTKEQGEFDYLDTEEARESAQFFRYRNWTYCLDQFMTWTSGDQFKGWDGYSADSAFSGVLIKLRRSYRGDGSQVVIVGRYCA